MGKTMINHPLVMGGLLFFFFFNPQSVGWMIVSDDGYRWLWLIVISGY